MTTKQVNNVRIIVEEGCSEKNLSAVRNWSAPDSKSAYYMMEDSGKTHCSMSIYDRAPEFST